MEHEPTAVDGSENGDGKLGQKARSTMVLRLGDDVIVRPSHPERLLQLWPVAVIEGFVKVKGVQMVVVSGFEEPVEFAAVERLID